MLEMSDVEERAAKCNVCSAELSIIENLLYGNRCLFCYGPFKNIRLLDYLLLCYYDWKIYQLMLQLWQKKGKDVKMFLLGCISEVGGIDIRDIRTTRDKRALIRALKEL